MIPHLCVLLTPEQIALDGSKTVSTDCIGSSIFDGNETFPFLRGCLHSRTQAMCVVVLRPRPLGPQGGAHQGLGIWNPAVGAGIRQIPPVPWAELAGTGGNISWYTPYSNM